MRALHRCEVGLGGVVLIELLLDVVVDGGGLFLECIDELGDGFVGAVFDFVPLEGLEVGFDGSCVSSQHPAHLKSSWRSVHTVVYYFLLLYFLLIPIEQVS